MLEWDEELQTNKQTIILRSFTDKVNGLIIYEILKPKFIQVTFAFDYNVAYMGIRLMKGFCRKLCNNNNKFRLCHFLKKIVFFSSEQL